MELEGYLTHHIETGVYEKEKSLVLILRTKQEIPTVAVLSREDLDELIDELKARRRWCFPRNVFDRLYRRWHEARHRYRSEA